jgi:hypothetical protein
LSIAKKNEFHRRRDKKTTKFCLLESFKSYEELIDKLMQLRNVPGMASMGALGRVLLNRLISNANGLVLSISAKIYRFL